VSSSSLFRSPASFGGVLKAAIDHRSTEPLMWVESSLSAFRRRLQNAGITAPTKTG
jgi:hypothetical protein